MAQTPRTFAELEALLADNNAEDISAQDLRDFVVSAMGCYGSMFVDGGAINQPLTATPAPLVNWTTAGPSRNVSAEPLNSRLLIQAPGIYRVTFAASVRQQATLDNFLFSVHILGVKISGFSAQVNAVNAGTEFAVAIGGLRELSDGDSVQVYASAADGSGTIRLQHGHLSVDRVG